MCVIPWATFDKRGSAEIARTVAIAMLQVLPGFLQLAIICLSYEHVRRALQASFVTRPADIGDLFQRNEILVVDLKLIISICQLEVGGSRLCDDIELSASHLLKC